METVEFMYGVQCPEWTGDAIIWILCLVVIPYCFDSDIKPNPMSWTQSMLYSCNTLVGSIV